MQPGGPVIAEIAGATTNISSGGVMRHDLAILGTQEIVTETPWTMGPVWFQGVLARDLMRDFVAAGGMIKTNALNNYTVVIPIVDVDPYNVVLARQRNGDCIAVRDEGPYGSDTHGAAGLTCRTENAIQGRSGTQTNRDRARLTGFVPA